MYNSSSLLFYVMEIAFMGLASIYVTRYYIAFRLVGGRKMKYLAFNKHAEKAANYVQSAAEKVNEKTKQNLAAAEAQAAAGDNYLKV